MQIALGIAFALATRPKPCQCLVARRFPSICYGRSSIPLPMRRHRTPTGDVCKNFIVQCAPHAKKAMDVSEHGCLKNKPMVRP